MTVKYLSAVSWKMKLCLTRFACVLVTLWRIRHCKFMTRMSNYSILGVAISNEKAAYVFYSIDETTLFLLGIFVLLFIKRNFYASRIRIENYKFEAMAWYSYSSLVEIWRTYRLAIVNRKNEIWRGFLQFCLNCDAFSVFHSAAWRTWLKLSPCGLSFTLTPFSK